MKQLYLTDPPMFTFRGRKQSVLPREKFSKWYVGRVKGRMDKVFAHELKLAKVSYFLPTRRREDGRVDLLLPGFVFFLGKPVDLYKAYDTHRLVQVIKAKDQKGLRLDLRRFAQFIENLSFDGFAAIQPGKLVRIKKPHSLAGVEAKVDLREGTRIGLDLSVLGQTALFRIDAKYLEVI